MHFFLKIEKKKQFQFPKDNLLPYFLPAASQMHILHPFNYQNQFNFTTKANSFPTCQFKLPYKPFRHVLPSSWFRQRFKTNWTWGWKNSSLECQSVHKIISNGLFQLTLALHILNLARNILTKLVKHDENLICDCKRKGKKSLIEIVFLKNTSQSRARDGNVGKLWRLRINWNEQRLLQTY